jgi:hypothetical protein
MRDDSARRSLDAAKRRLLNTPPMEPIRELETAARDHLGLGVITALVAGLVLVAAPKRGLLKGLSRAAMPIVVSAIGRGLDAHR